MKLNVPGLEFAEAIKTRDVGKVEKRLSALGMDAEAARCFAQACIDGARDMRLVTYEDARASHFEEIQLQKDGVCPPAKSIFAYNWAREVADEPTIVLKPDYFYYRNGVLAVSMTKGGELAFRVCAAGVP